MTRRVRELHQAMPEAVCEIHPEDTRTAGIAEGSQVRVITRRGELVLKATTEGRGRPDRGILFIPFFDEDKLVNLLTLDAFCPISKQPDYKKCAARIEPIPGTM